MPDLSMSDRHRRYVGRRRASAPGQQHRARRELIRGPHRIVLVVAAVAAVLFGTGALAGTLPFQPIILSTGSDAEAPDQPGGDAPADPPAGTADTGTVPTPAPTATAAPDGVRPALPVPSPTVEPRNPAPTDPPATEPPVPDPVTVVYEAEDAELSGFVRLFEMEGASGGGVIGTIGLDLLNHVRFPEVTVDTAGAYELTLYYAGAPERQAMVSVNDAEMLTIDFPALGDASTIGSVSIEVQLAAGPNVIWFGNTIGLAPALDRITVTG